MKNKIILLLISVFILLIPHNAKASEVTVNIFYGKECPYCEKEMKYLDVLKKQYKDNITIKKYEVWHNKENNKLLEKVRKELKNNETGVPYTIIGTKDLTGYNTQTKEEIKKLIDQNLKQKEIDVTSYIKENKTIPNKKIEENQNINLAGFNLNIKDTPTPLIAAILGFLDSLSLSSIWILLFIISILLIIGKKHVPFFAIPFIIAQIITYIILITTHPELSELSLLILRSLIALIAIFIAAITLNKYLDGKEIKLILELKEKLKNKKILIISSFILGLIITLIQISYVDVNLFKTILEIKNTQTLEYIFNMFIYIIFFILIDIIFTIILSKTKNKNYLISGIILLILGAVLILKPEWLMFI